MCANGCAPAVNWASNFRRISSNMLRRGALEGKDRLLFVADREESARTWALPAPGREIAGKLFENFPLGFARVLRLIDKNMVDSGIELVEHPARIRAFEQSQASFR